jgi:hypothetical protein
MSRSTLGQALKGSGYKTHKRDDELVGPARLRDDRYIRPFLGDFVGWITAMNDKWHAKLAQSPAYRCSVLSTEMQIDHRS